MRVTAAVAAASIIAICLANSGCSQDTENDGQISSQEFHKKGSIPHEVLKKMQEAKDKAKIEGDKNRAPQ